VPHVQALLAVASGQGRRSDSVSVALAGQLEASSPYAVWHAYCRERTHSVAIGVYMGMELEV